MLMSTVEKNEGPGFVPRPCLTALFLVRPRGLEPPLRFQNQHLKLATEDDLETIPDGELLTLPSGTIPPG